MWLAALREHAAGDGRRRGLLHGRPPGRPRGRVDPEVVAVAGFHGGGLVDDDPESPHLLIAGARAEYVFGHADQDRSMTPQAVAALGEALDAAGVTATNEIYPESSARLLDGRHLDVSPAGRRAVVRGAPRSARPHARSLTRGRPTRGASAAAGRVRSGLTDDTEESPMPDLTGRTIAFLVAPEGIEQVELTDPWAAVEDAGGTPKLVSPRRGTVQAFDHLDKADTFPVDAVVGGRRPGDYDALVLPGGVANPDALRTDQDAVSFVRDFVERTSRWRPSATRPGRWSRPTSCGAGG